MKIASRCCVLLRNIVTHRVHIDAALAPNDLVDAAHGCMG